MLSGLIIGYPAAVTLAFVGVARLPRARWLLLVLGTLGVLVPAAGLVVLLSSLDDLRFG